MEKLQEQEIVERIISRYETPTKEVSKLDEIKSLDKKAKRPAIVFSYIFGVLGTLLLGSGMSLAMKVIGASLPALMIVGIVVGALGIVMVSVNYAIYKKILAAGKAKYSAEIIAKSNDLLNKKEGE